MAHFRFASEILRRLGEELNPGVDQSILELVKNSYDADASWCEVRFEGVDRPGGRVLVRDDGVGMHPADIASAWLVLGRSSKTTTKLTGKNRTSAGNKGLGRLAALRMGQRVILRTRPQNSPQVFSVTIDWNTYADAQTVEEVDLPIAKAPAGDFDYGTEVVVDGLYKAISRGEARKLARAMLLLADPFSDSPDSFRPRISSEEFADLAEIVSRSYFDEADFHLSAILDDKGMASAEISDWQGNVLWTANHETLGAPTKHHNRPYNAPPAHFDFWAFRLSSESFSVRSSSLSEVRQWLRAVGNVHLYINGLRIAPYGNEGNDWLGLNAARVASPEERPSTNNSIGRVTVVDPSEKLRQKTDRSGIIENDEFEELKAFAANALSWLARERMRQAENRRRAQREAAPQKTKNAKEIIKKTLNNMSSSEAKPLIKQFEQYERSAAEEISSLQREVDLYRTLASAGITAATFAHESHGGPFKVLDQAVPAIERRARKLLPDLYDKEFAEPIEDIRKSMSGLRVLAIAILRMLRKSKRRRGYIDVHQLIREVLSTYEPFLNQRHAHVVFEESSARAVLLGTPAGMESIISNLLTNSLAAFERAESFDRTIKITTRVDVGSRPSVTINVADTGPGITDLPLDDIWLPGQTSNPEGTGLGLVIVKDCVSDLGGQVAAHERSELGGAEFVIRLPILASSDRIRAAASGGQRR
ncbi:sensor histidine kinase [Microbispora sp. H10830]|uniref:sensor histidine kinase n=1 Tax=Microbispora sp. H10830 TaxID=2729109 RepID=UPI00160006FD|nr:sensor histidine kinase [Microbispora sp. H10830]